MHQSTPSDEFKKVMDITKNPNMQEDKLLQQHKKSIKESINGNIDYPSDIELPSGLFKKDKEQPQNQQQFNNRIKP